MNDELLKMVEVELEAARQKHPVFATVLDHVPERFSRITFHDYALSHKKEISIGVELSAKCVVFSELCEVFAAAYDGDEAHARQEIAQTIGTLCRLWENLPQLMARAKEGAQ